MPADQQTRSYCLPFIHLQVCCSAAMASCLDARFRMFPTSVRRAEPEFCLEFRAVTGAREHAVERPQGDARTFYEMPRGEASYFSRTDEMYISFGDGLRALCQPLSGQGIISVIETEPRNVFMASHLVLTLLLVEILRRQGWYSLHAAGFGEKGKAILIPGTSGAGKSTLSIALLRAKFDYLSDDMVFLARRDGGLVVRGLTEDVDVSEQTIRFFPELQFLLQSPTPDGFTKKQLRADATYGTRVVAELQPRVIILPRIAGTAESTIMSIGDDEAFREIVPNVLLTEPRACQSHLGALAELIKQADCYRLETGQDFDRIPTLLRALLDHNREAVLA